MICLWFLLIAYKYLQSWFWSMINKTVIKNVCYKVRVNDFFLIIFYNDEFILKKFRFYWV